ncbi:MAG: hypothetical protein HRF43_16645 [Phycisphaerae bacterium]
MRRLRKNLVPVLMVLMLGLLAGGDIECEIDDWPGIHVIGLPFYDVVVVEDYWYDPWYWWW